ncbi:MAG: hypothetical protein FD131_1188 [Rhodocyclaceae bacterium]|nr:MAG: hypothetical protein FD131_1188 [Rhodocyclaceae bacterium]
MKIRFTTLLVLLALNAAPSLAEAPHEAHMKADTVDYALILPANLPHILRTANGQAGKLGLDEAQKQLVRELMAEAPLQVMSRLQKAEKLEQAIANDVLYQRQGVADIKSRLDELVRLKREATEAQIATVNRIQAAISEAQFRKLLKLAVADAH